MKPALIIFCSLILIVFIIAKWQHRQKTKWWQWLYETKLTDKELSKVIQGVNAYRAFIISSKHSEIEPMKRALWVMLEKLRVNYSPRGVLHSLKYTSYNALFNYGTGLISVKELELIFRKDHPNLNLPNKIISNIDEYEKLINKQPVGTEEYKKHINAFIDKMKEIPDWYNIIQARGNGHAMAEKSMNIKVNDYEYWANGHKEEYLLKFNDGNLDIDGIKLRIEKFSFIVVELEKVIKKADELKFNITHEMHNDYCAARASLLGAEYTLKEIKKKQDVLRVDENETNDINDVTYYKGKPFSGIAFGSFESGTNFETEFKDGLKHGLGKEFYNNGQLKCELKYENDKMVEVVNAFTIDGVQIESGTRTEDSRKRLTYISKIIENNKIIETVEDSYSKLKGFKEGFYDMSDWEQILFIILNMKKHQPVKDNPINKVMFATWVGNEFRFTNYSFTEDFKLTLAPKLIEFYSNDIELEELENFFNDNVVWKNNKSLNKSDNYEIDNNLPAYENLLGVELFKKDLSGLKAYCTERPNMGGFFKKLTNFIRNGYSVSEVLSSSDNDINDPEIREILATGFWDISNFLKSMLDIKENDEVRKDYDACLEAIQILKDY